MRILAMYTLYGRDSFCAGHEKLYRIGLLYKHKYSDFSAMCVTECSCAAPISRVESHI